MTTILCWASIIPDSFHSGGLLSMINSTNELFVLAKVFKTTVATFLPNGSIWSGSENTT